MLPTTSIIRINFSGEIYFAKIILETDYAEFSKKLFQNTGTPISDTTRKIIDQMIAYGMKQSHPYVIEFAFFGDSTKLSQLRDSLIAKGFKQDTSQTDKMLVLTNSVPLDYEHTGSSIAEMKKIAGEFGVTFDGWSADPNQQ